MEKTNLPGHVTALLKAVEICGDSQGALAQRIREITGIKTVSQQTVSYWIKSEALLDAKYWPGIEQATGGKVTREDLRPDVFRVTKARGASRASA